MFLYYAASHMKATLDDILRRTLELDEVTRSELRLCRNMAQLIADGLKDAPLAIHLDPRGERK